MLVSRAHTHHPSAHASTSEECFKACFLLMTFKLEWSCSPCLCLLCLSRFLTGASFLLPQRPKGYRGDSATFHLTSYSLVYLELLATMLVTYLASLACKLHMQKAAFALPLMLSPPVSLAIVYLQCHFHFLPTHWHMGTWYCPAMDWHDLIMPVACAAALWMSYCLIVSHIWFPKSERMAKVEK